MRLSKEDSDVFGRKIESGSITSQRNLIFDFIRNQPEFDGCNVVERCDDGISGRFFDSRPQFTDMIELAKKGKINCIIVKDASRFGRDYVELGDYLEQVFPVWGVRFISINDHYDSDRTEAGLDIAFRNLVYDIYSRDLSKKLRMSMRQMAAQGKYTATQPRYGYRKKKDDKHSLEPDPETAPVVREIFDMRLAGMELTEIAKNLNERGIKCSSVLRHDRNEVSIHSRNLKNVCWTAGVIENMLTNEIYTGTVVSLRYTTDRMTGKLVKRPESEWIKTEGMHEAIVSKEEFQKVQRMIRRRKSSKFVRNVRYRCGLCGKALTKERGDAIYCRQASFMGADCECRKVRGKKSLLNAIVLGDLKRKLARVLDAEELKLETSSEECGMDSLKSAMDAVKKEKQVLFEKLADRQIDRENFKACKAEIDSRIAELEQRIDDARVREALIEETRGRADVARSFLDVEEMTEAIWEKFVEVVYLYPEMRMEIVWKFEDVDHV
jgi:DNA invertase Pin-like site-specific DNA recombinase